MAKQSNKVDSDPNTDAVAFMLVMCAIMGGFLLLLWWLREERALYWAYVIRSEAWVIAHLPFVSAETVYNANGIREVVGEWLSRNAVHEMPPQTRAAFTNWVFQYTRFPYTIAGIILTFFMMHKRRRSSVLSGRELMERESVIYPWLRPVLKFRPENASADDGPYQFRLSLEEFVEKNDLIIKGGEVAAGAATRDKLDRNKAAIVFARQLESPYQDFRSLSLERKTWLLCMIARMEKSKGVLKSLIEVSNHWSCQEASVADLESALLKAYKALWDTDSGQFVRDTLERHAYFLSAVPEITDETMERGGALSTTPYKWIKFTDRRLYFAFHDAGHNPSCEIGGIDVHGKYEVAIGKACVEPYVEPAIVALEDMLWKSALISKPAHIAAEEQRLKDRSKPIAA